MTVLARDAVASDHLVYAWPFPIGPECEVVCADDEQVVMSPAWMVGDRLGPGRHRWRTPDPSRPVGAFFVLTAPVEVSFDMVTGFIVPATGMPIRLRASGSLQVRCSDPGLLIAQFVGLPFDSVNEGVLRSVSRSVERMLARLLTRRAVMAGTPIAVTDGGMLPGIIEELIAYNPTAGAVFGVELIRMGHLVIVADDGTSPYLALPATNQSWQPNGHGHGHHGHHGHESHGHEGHGHDNGHGRGHRNAHTPTTPPPIAEQQPPAVSTGPQYTRPQTPVLETIRGMPAVEAPLGDEAPTPIEAPSLGRFDPHAPPTQASGEIVPRHSTRPPSASPPSGPPAAVVSGEIVPRTASGPVAAPPPGPPVAEVSGEIVPRQASGPVAAPPQPGPPVAVVSGEIVPRHTSIPPSSPPAAAAPPSGPPVATVSGEIGAKTRPSAPVITPVPTTPQTPPATVSGEIKSRTTTTPLGIPPVVVATPVPRLKPSTLPPPLPSLPRKTPPIEVPAAVAPLAEAIRPENPAPVQATPAPAPVAKPVVAPKAAAPKAAASDDSRGSIMGSGMGAVGATPVRGEVTGEIAQKIAPGQRVLVPGPNGLMQSATVRQLLQGYYELEVGSSGQTIWVPVGGVVPEQT